jgi:hypothetical protein
MKKHRSMAETALLADRIAGAVTGCPLVARLAGGFTATYLPGRTVPGVAVREDGVRIAVVAIYGPPLADIVDQVRTAASRRAPGLRVDVTIDDLELPDDGRRPR